MRLEFYKTFFEQIELLPRITIIYSTDEDIDNGIAFEFLWFGLFINLTN